MTDQASAGASGPVGEITPEEHCRIMVGEVLLHPAAREVVF